MRHGSEAGRLNQQSAFGFDYPTIFKTKFKSWSSRFTNAEAILEQFSLNILDHADHKDVSENKLVPAGYTYLGQLISHDITHFSGGQNMSSPTLDLDCIYGGGPTRSVGLYQRSKSGSNTTDSEARYLFRLGLPKVEPPNPKPETIQNSCPFDLPRVQESSEGLQATDLNFSADPIISDPRNDEHLILSQLHVFFMYFHNIAAQTLVDAGMKPEKAFKHARRFVVTTYQDIVFNDYCNRLLSSKLVKEFRKKNSTFFEPPTESGIKRRIKRNGKEIGFQSLIPLEFSLAAGRFGHAMVRERYKVNSTVTDVEGTLRNILSFSHFSSFQSNDCPLPLPSKWLVNWAHFFELEPGKTETIKSRKITPFVHNSFGTKNHPTNARRDVFKSANEFLPSGQDFAKRLKNKLRGRSISFDILKNKEDFIFDNNDEGYGNTDFKDDYKEIFANDEIAKHTPLFVYILAEAASKEGGKRLGVVGSYIVGTTLRLALPDAVYKRNPIATDMVEVLKMVLGDAGVLKSKLGEFVDTSTPAKSKNLKKQKKKGK